MKKLLVIAVVVALSALVATAAFAGVAGSLHDLTTGNTTAVVKATTSTISSCQFCHTPHRADTSVANTPLWNKVMTTATFTVYGGGTTLNGTTVNQPGARSKTCLTCHDGTLSVGAVIVGNSQGITAVANRVSAAGLLDSTSIYNIGTDLSNDHPVGFTVTAGRGGTFAAIADFGTNGFPLAASNTFECSTCHDPHMTTNSHFLRKPLATICSDCHISK